MDRSGVKLGSRICGWSSPEGDTKEASAEGGMKEKWGTGMKDIAWWKNSIVMVRE